MGVDLRVGSAEEIGQNKAVQSKVKVIMTRIAVE
jgi:hypothetical protein